MYDVCRFPVTRIGEVHIQKRLFAVLSLIDHVFTVGRPCNSRDEQVGWLILKRIDPANVAACGTNYTERDKRVRIAGLWIRGKFNILVIRNVIDHSEFRNWSFVEPQEGQG